MPRTNIFASKELTLKYDGTYFILLKGDHALGSTYDPKSTRDLIKTIQNEMRKSEHDMQYNLEEFNITPKARKKLESRVLADN